jgi:hypothetical protein
MLRSVPVAGRRLEAAGQDGEGPTDHGLGGVGETTLEPAPEASDHAADQDVRVHLDVRVVARSPEDRGDPPRDPRDEAVRLDGEGRLDARGG